MREGWSNDDYLILFEGEEISAASKSYAIPDALPGYEVIGLRGWDDFIVRNKEGHVFTVPTIPLDERHLAPFQAPNAQHELQINERFLGKIKWYVKPLIFSGDPSSDENRIWVDHLQHAQLVRFWNDLYRSVAAPNS